LCSVTEACDSQGMVRFVPSYTVLHRVTWWHLCHSHGHTKLTAQFVKCVILRYSDTRNSSLSLLSVLSSDTVIHIRVIDAGACW
jgi:hypothetical protein